MLTPREFLEDDQLDSYNAFITLRVKIKVILSEMIGWYKKLNIIYNNITFNPQSKLIVIELSN